MKPLIYGTAWKKERTADLVVRAVRLGFKAIDTACQPKHYNEKGVGEGLARLRQEAGIDRKSLWLQTKFTPLSGQDPKQVPYNPEAELDEQVRQSFAVSQANLGTDYVDSLVLHSPLPNHEQLMRVWTAMEVLYKEGKAKILGISNCYDLNTLQNLYRDAEIKPAVIQNRFYAQTNYDDKLRVWCRSREVDYQAFWTLTANPHILDSQTINALSLQYEKTTAQIFYRFLCHCSIAPLIGSSSEAHMKEDLAVFSFDLTAAEIEAVNELLLL